MSSNFTKARALVVGIADYEHVTSLPDMIRRDAVDIAAALSAPEVSGYNPLKVQILTNGKATAAAIRAELTKASAEVTEDEIFSFYFSGHGARIMLGSEEHSCLAPYETDLTDLAATALVDSELMTLLNAIPARRQMIILDACHSGGVGSLKGIAASTPLPAARGFDTLAKGRGRVVLCSSRPDEVSLALQRMSNSVFTAVLLNALYGATADRGDGLIGVFDLFSYVAAEVPKLANQHPVFKADGLEDNFAIARRPITETTAPLLKAVALSEQEQIEALMCALYPLGPMQDKVWQRAGGDAARLDVAGKGVAQWHAAIRMLTLGGGGLTLAALLEVAFEDYSSNETLAALRATA